MPHWWPAVVTSRRYSMPAHTSAGSHTTPHPRSAACRRGVSTGTASNPAAWPNAAATAALTPSHAGPVITSGGSMLRARRPKSDAAAKSRERARRRIRTIGRVHRQHQRHPGDESEGCPRKRRKARGKERARGDGRQRPAVLPRARSGDRQRLPFESTTRHTKRARDFARGHLAANPGRAHRTDHRDRRQ